MKKSKEYRKKKGITFSSITNGQGGSLKLAYKGKGMVDIDTIMEEYAEHYYKQKLAEMMPEIEKLLKAQIEECRHFVDRCARDKGMASKEFNDWIKDTPIIKIEFKSTQEEEQ